MLNLKPQFNEIIHIGDISLKFQYNKAHPFMEVDDNPRKIAINQPIRLSSNIEIIFYIDKRLSLRVGITAPKEINIYRQKIEDYVGTYGIEGDLLSRL